MSQDPVFVNLGVDRRTAQVLRDPQQLNSYSYARGNPITLKDPTGEALPLLAGFLAIPTGSAILHWIGLGSMAIGLVKTAESFHSNIILPRQYKNAYTPEQIAEAPFRFAAEATLNVGTNTIEPVGAQLASDIFLTGLEYVPADLLEERRKDRFETNSRRFNNSQGPSSFAPTSGGGGGVFAPTFGSVGSGNSFSGYAFTSAQQGALQGFVNVVHAGSFDAQAFVSALQAVVSAFSPSSGGQ
jgi:hypothetical protein